LLSKYLAQRVPIEEIYKLKFLNDLDKEIDMDQLSPSNAPWSAYEICASYATKRSFFAGKSGRPDTYRAALSILKDVLDGRVCLFFLPNKTALNFLSDIKEENDNEDDVKKEGKEGEEEEEEVQKKEDDC